MVKQAKKTLRSLVLATRASLNAEDRAERSIRIAESFLALPEVELAGRFLLYCSVGSEVETRRLIARLIAQEKTVSLPLVDSDRLYLCPRHIQNLEGLVVGAHKIPSPPADAPKLAPELIEVAVLPGVAFDLEGWRLGYGGGYYDRFLARSSALRVGLAFEAQIVEKTPQELHDQRVDVIVTEGRVIRPGLGNGLF